MKAINQRENESNHAGCDPTIDETACNRLIKKLTEVNKAEITQVEMKVIKIERKK